jgi:hypothetical protein
LGGRCQHGEGLMVLCYGEPKLVFAGPMSLVVTCESYTFLGAIAKLQKATISFVMSPSARMEQLGSHWTDFHEIWYLSIFRNSVEKIQVSLKSDKNKGYFR